VLACVICGRLKSAFQIASRSESISDVQYVAHVVINPTTFAYLFLRVVCHAINVGKYVN
jgi:zinc finger FYVE domain-containing protein 26